MSIETGVAAEVGEKLEVGEYWMQRYRCQHLILPVGLCLCARERRASDGRVFLGVKVTYHWT